VIYSRRPCLGQGQCAGVGGLGLFDGENPKTRRWPSHFRAVAHRPQSLPSSSGIYQAPGTVIDEVAASASAGWTPAYMKP